MGRISDSAPDRGRRPSGELEAEVLAALWAADQPLVTAQVRAALTSDPGAPPAYNTVQTILTRLQNKGVVVREPAGRAHAYRPVLDGPGIAARQMRAALERGGDHAAVLRRFLTDLDAGDAAMLAEVLRQTDPSAASERGAADNSFSDSRQDAVG